MESEDWSKWNSWRQRIHGKLRIGQSGTAGDRESMENLGLVKVEQLATENLWET